MQGEPLNPLLFLVFPGCAQPHIKNFGHSTPYVLSLPSCPEVRVSALPPHPPQRRAQRARSRGNGLETSPALPSPHGHHHPTGSKTLYERVLTYQVYPSTISHLSVDCDPLRRGSLPSGWILLRRVVILVHMRIDVDGWHPRQPQHIPSRKRAASRPLPSRQPASQAPGSGLVPCYLATPAEHAKEHHQS